MRIRFAAAGLNAESGNCAADPDWNAALFAVAARSDIDNGGLMLRSPMPDWLVPEKEGASTPPTTQDFADIFAFLGTQTQLHSCPRRSRNRSRSVIAL